MEWLKTIAPTAATLLGGPLAGMAVKFLADKIGVPEATQETVAQALQNMQETPEGRVKLAEIDSDLRKHAIDSGIDLEKLAVQNASDINETMRAEAAAEHWPSYTWRPAIGFAVAIDLVASVIIVLIAYTGVMFFHIDPNVLSYLPALLGAMAALVGVASPILGIASWFRGKMQADPSVPTNNKG